MKIDIDPKDPVGPSRLRSLEEHAWSRFDEKRARRRRVRKGAVIGALVTVLAAGVAFGSGAVSAERVGHDILHGIHEVLMEVHEFIFGSRPDIRHHSEPSPRQHGIPPSSHPR